MRIIPSTTPTTRTLPTITPQNVAREIQYPKISLSATAATSSAIFERVQQEHEARQHIENAIKEQKVAVSEELQQQINEKTNRLMEKSPPFAKTTPFSIRDMVMVLSQSRNNISADFYTSLLALEEPLEDFSREMQDVD